jgi:hypothetical protein
MSWQIIPGAEKNPTREQMPDSQHACEPNRRGLTMQILLDPDPDPGEAAPHREYRAIIDGGPSFRVGASVQYVTPNGHRYVGLVNEDPAGGVLYSAADFEGDFPFWARLMELTAYAEGRIFHTLNTYDLGYFTFGFIQFAAHANDFRRWLRKLLQLPAAANYFPDLSIVNAHIHKEATDLETGPVHGDRSQDPLVNYFNPSLDAVEHAEVLNAARLVHWTNSDATTRRLQVKIAVALFHEYLKTANELGLPVDGAVDFVCIAVCDIMHQHGDRAKTRQLRAALSSSDPMPALYRIMGDYDRNRPERFKRRLEQLLGSAAVGDHEWQVATNEFRPKSA